MHIKRKRVIHILRKTKQVKMFALSFCVHCTCLRNVIHIDTYLHYNISQTIDTNASYPKRNVTLVVVELLRWYARQTICIRTFTFIIPSTYYSQLLNLCPTPKRHFLSYCPSINCQPNQCIPAI